MTEYYECQSELGFGGIKFKIYTGIWVFINL